MRKEAHQETILFTKSRFRFEFWNFFLLEKLSKAEIRMKRNENAHLGMFEIAKRRRKVITRNVLIS